MKNFFLTIASCFILLSCNHSEEKKVSIEDSLTVSTQDGTYMTALLSGDVNAEQTKDFTTSKFASGQFTLTVRYDGKTFTTPIKMIADSVNITPHLYRELNDSNKGSLLIWFNKKGKVLRISRLGTTKNTDGSVNMVPIWDIRQFPLLVHFKS